MKRYGNDHCEGLSLTGLQKRKRREYRLARKAAFARPEPGFSLYEGRTRGKRMRYTYSDDEYGSDGLSSRPSPRVSMPPDNGPTVTASGRQVRSRVGGMYGESILVDQRRELERAAGEGHFTETSEDLPSPAPTRGVRQSRSGRVVKAVGEQYANGGDSESDEAQSSGKEWSGNEDEPDESEPDFDAEDEDDDMSDEALEPDELGEDDNTQESLVVQLRYRKGKEGDEGMSGQPPTKELQQPLFNGDTMNGSMDSAEALKTLQQPAGTMVSESIDVAPLAKSVNGGQGIPNGIENQEQPIQLSPPTHLQQTVQHMDLS